MKKNKIFLTALFVVTMSFGSFAQGGGIWNFQWVIGVPMGETSDFLSQASVRGFGVEGRGFVTDNLTVGGRIGWQTFYQNFDFVTIETEDFTISGYQRKYVNAIPITIGAHYYFGRARVLPYAGVGVGPYYVETRDYMGIYYVEEKNWHFGVAPELGVVIPFGDSNSGINFAAKYQYAAKTKDAQSVSWLEFDIGISYVF